MATRSPLEQSGGLDSVARQTEHKHTCMLYVLMLIVCLLHWWRDL